MLSVWFESNSEIRSNVVEVKSYLYFPNIYLLFLRQGLSSPACPGSRLDWPGTELHLPLPPNSWD